MLPWNPAKAMTNERYSQGPAKRREFLKHRVRLTGNLKKFMKNQSGRQRKTSTSLPLEGGGKRVGVKEPPGCQSYPSP